MSNHQTKQAIVDALQAFSKDGLAESAVALLDSLGYTSEKRPSELSDAPADFIANFDSAGKLNSDKALLDQWKSIHVLFQLTSEEIRTGSQLALDFGTAKKVDNAIIESYLFFALKLSDSYYTRTQLASITREINKLFPMPAMVIFRHGGTLTFSIINRRLHMRDESKDVLEKVTLIKDIDFVNPHRAHIEILFDLSLDELYHEYEFTNFVELHRAWQKVLDSSELNKRFFKEIADWYFWAVQHVTFPKDAGAVEEVRNATSVIRLITRLIFIWFIKEKRLVPEDLFDQRRLRGIINLSDPNGSTYYKAILQNLFFATLNQEMNRPTKPDNRKFRSRSKHPGGRDPHYTITNLYRYEAYFQNPAQALALFSRIPFLNGGLFECLDKPDQKDPSTILRIDGFSDRADNELCVPDFLFFSDEQDVDLNDAYGTTSKHYRVRGLIDILNRYKFTINENTPIEEEVALDPELLGKVFENLLAAYNPETGATARKQTGSFYTPREIVNYMVDEALIAYLESQLKVRIPALNDMDSLDDLLREVLAYTEKAHPFNEDEVAALIEAIDSIKVLDPACGSGAFPMGILHKLVFILNKLDPHNERWKQKQLAKADEIPDSTIRQRAIADIEEAFERNELDYGRKLYLVENCIYGVDIQPIAVQIAKLRFFISLVVDQKTDDAQENRGITPLPNLETRFVAANTLISLNRPGQQMLRNLEIDAKDADLHRVRERHFLARTPATKAKCREQDARLRAEIAGLLKSDGWDTLTARRLAKWDPYDQNASADFFDSEWMFGQVEGFDVTIGNPPYVRIQTLTQTDAEQAAWLKEHYASARKGNYDLYVVFVERSLQLLQPRGQLAFILPHKFFNAQYGQPLRKLLAGGKHLRHVVHFGDQQIFPGATNYVCLLFLDKGGAKQCRFARADDLPAWLADGVATEAQIADSRVTDAEWNFAVGQGAGLFEKLQRMPVKLGDVAEIFVGLQTSADDVFILNFVSENTRSLTLESKALGLQWTFEKSLLHPLLSGTDIGPCEPLPKRQFILFPYTVQNEQATLIPMKRLISEYPKTAEYLLRNKKRLEEREHGTFRGDSWHRFGRNQNLGIQGRVKLCVPRLVESLHAAFDAEGSHFLDNVDVGGVTLRPEFSSHSLAYLLALLNSSLLRWFFPQVSAPFRGGFRSANRQFLSLIPIRPIDFSVASEQAEHDALTGLAKQVLAAKRADLAADTSAWEREIDERVYRLYGLTKEEIRIVEESSAKGGGGET